MLNRFTHWMSAAALMASAVGCAHHSKEVSEDQVQQMTEFRLSREDVVEVSVWKEGELSRTVPIRPDGKITLPLIGDVQAEGLKPSELEQNVQKALAPLVRDPRVSVIVHDVNGARVYVTGMVTHAGAFPLRSGMNVLQALALAGGLQEFADRGEIAVVREGRKISVDYDDLVNGKSRIALQAGDTVVVP